eukprot:CAMPEP_0172370338 /NCGR_PEP_ID=MMETSP1060-20121228/37179_1 /TAXON_ID=37318 /ORGANISM="Pseudo-nitzschia pungens, Strain cf. cingulata" /LENGTH=393 /DNA_ID=CAMNT_0013095565 /DNA_START=179 /DNA_END=1360 /DNA_ORIENTATION=+
MKLLYSLAATIVISLLVSTSTAWVIGSPTRVVNLRRSGTPQPLSTRRRRAQLHRISKLDASGGSDDNSAASIATLPNFSSLFNRTDNATDVSTVNEKNDNVNLAYSIQQRKFATNFMNNDNDLDNFSSEATESNNEAFLLTALALTVAAGIAALASSQGTLADPSLVLATGSSILGSARDVFADPGAALDHVVELTDSMGPLGIAYFGVAYCIAEILAIPAIPLTASAGYLFGPVKGTAIVLLSASVAAAVSFAIGRTFLRDYVEGILKEYPKFSKLDKAIGREGFKLMLLLRLSPIFPFALSNYLYGATSINFSAFFGGTLLGFAPGTIAYVYTGYVGKALTGDVGSDVYPWYVYLGGLTLFAGFLKVVADTATRVVQEIEAEEEASQNNTT